MVHFSDIWGIKMDIVWFAEIKWDYLKTRKQQIIGRKPDDIRLLYLEPYVRGRQNRFSLRSEGDIFCATVPFIKSAPGGLARFALDRKFMRSAVDTFARFRVERLISQVGFDSKNIGKILSNIYSIYVASSMPGRFLLYDCNDAHTSFPGMPEWSESYYNHVCRSADAIFASARALMKSVSETRGSSRGVEYLGNGVDFARFLSPENGKADSAQTVRSQFIYIGAIAPWVDFGSMRALANQHPEWTIVLVGPVLQGAEQDYENLVSLPNVIRYEPVPYDVVPHVLGRASVALIPFQYNTLTRGVNPNKLYEYLAAGLPVVTTRFSEEVQMYPEVVRPAEPGDEFVTACEEMLQACSGDSQPRIAEAAKRIARENDWDAIAEAFWQRVKKIEAVE